MRIIERLRVTVGEGSHNPGTPSDLAVEALNDVVCADPRPAFGGEIAIEAKYTYDNFSRVIGCTVENGANKGRVAGNHTFSATMVLTVLAATICLYLGNR